MRRLPPLNAVRAFEAAARHLSFNRAAAELCVTASAVSHQVRALEDHFGVRLFERRGRDVMLTEAGRGFAPAATVAFDQIDAASRRLRRRSAVGLLDMVVAPTFATGWLVPRISEFQVDHPDFEVRMSAKTVVGEWESLEFDVAIVYGTKDWPRGLASHWLMGEDLVPVCSPSLVAPAGPLATVADVRRVTLLHVLPRIGQWRNWLAVAGITDVDAERGPKFQNTGLALVAAIAGGGIAIANRAFVGTHLESGRLVVPFDVELPSDAGYYLLYSEPRTDEPAIAAFRDWVLDKVDRELPDHALAPEWGHPDPTAALS